MVSGIHFCRILFIDDITYYTFYFITRNYSFTPNNYTIYSLTLLTRIKGNIYIYILINEREKKKKSEKKN